MHAYDLGRYQRLVGVSDGRITGNFAVLIGIGKDESWVKAHDVVIWDESHNWGNTFYSNDLTGSVKDGVAEISKHMVASNRLASVEAVWDEMLAVMVAVVEAAKAAIQGETPDA